MSWFDSSLSFAKTAFTQAQKSIDKVLDINESQSGVDGQGISVEILVNMFTTSLPTQLVYNLRFPFC